MVDTLSVTCPRPRPETELLVAAVFEFSVFFVNAVKPHVNDADLLANQDILGRASDNRRCARRPER